MASDRNGTLYIGVTNNLFKRVKEHKDKVVKSFTKKYNVIKLVYYEAIEDLYAARIREAQMKKWNRDWKLKIIEKKNPYWNDLYEVMMKECEMPGSNLG